jgi:Flp pilus assembly protein TadD
MADRATPGRNEGCPCGSGRKFKGCCGNPQATGKGAEGIPTAAAERVLRRAEQLLRTGQYERALGPLVEGARLFPRNPALLSDLGVTYLFTRRLPEAIQWLRRAIDLQPTRARSHFNLGLAMDQSGDFTAAFESYRRAIALDPQLAEAHGRMADILMRDATGEEAAAAYCRAFAAAPETTFGRLCEAKAMVALDRVGEAHLSPRFRPERNASRDV